jgi:integrase/recombinase XerC
MADAGLRLAEVCGLTLHDLTAGGQIISALRIRSEIAKGGRERIIPLTDRLRGVIQMFYKDEVHRYRDPATACFPARSGPDNHINPRTIEKMLENAGRAALGYRIHPHLLRHSFASRMLEVSDIRIVQELLGHRNISSTQIYTHPSADLLKNSIDKLNGPDVK